jgi:hypothetical protein
VNRDGITAGEIRALQAQGEAQNMDPDFVLIQF